MCTEDIISYGTVVQLGIATNAHWSASLYKGLNEIQLKDSRDMCLINRDVASGFRLDTLTTCK